MYLSGPRRHDGAAVRTLLGSRVLDRIAPGRRWVTLEDTGRISGESRSFPLGMADVDGQWVGLGADAR